MNKVKNKTAGVEKRIAISHLAMELLELEVTRIKEKGSHYKLNESKLASAILELFFKKYLIKELEQIESEFFDKKMYLKILIEKSSTEEELAKSLDLFFNKSKTKKTSVVHDE
mgnify:CR=1 FL=1